MIVQGDFRIDLDKYYRIEFRGRPPSLRRRLKLWSTHFGLQCVAIYRLGRFCRAGRRRGDPLAWILFPCFEVLCFLVKLVFQVDVFAADIGPGFYIGHVGTLYIGPTVVGANFSVTHNVTVGMGSANGTHGLPVLGRDVWVGTGSILYGDIVIGNGVTVNGGTVLSRSIPDRCLAGGNPGRVILRNYDNAHLFALPGSERAPAPEAEADAGAQAVQAAVPDKEPAIPENAVGKAVQAAVEAAVPVVATAATVAAAANAEASAAVAAVASAAAESVNAAAAMVSAALAAPELPAAEGIQAGTPLGLAPGASAEPLKN